MWFATETGAVRVAFDDQSWVDAACAFAGRELSVDEWHRYVDHDPDSSPVALCT